MRRAEVAGGGYVNLFLDRGAFAQGLVASLAAAAPAAGRRGHVIVEHTSINPNKAAHIGHLRNACLGDTFVRLLRHRGCDVGVQNYIDDTGVQVADVVVGFQHLERKSLAEVEAIGGKFDYYCWDLYARVGDFYAADPAARPCRPRPSTPSRKAATTPPASPSTWPRASSTATSPPWRGSASATTCSPTRATSCGCTSGTAPSSC